MASFKEAFLHTIEMEGGYANHKADRGGETMWGITKKVARANGYYKSMRELPKDIAMEIYKDNYWDPLRLDQVNNQITANELFDTAVNMGVGTSAKFLQTACNWLGSTQLKVDGRVGQKTLQAMSYINSRNLLKMLNGLQFERYRRICILRPSQKVFFRGWLRRV